MGTVKYREGRTDTQGIPVRCRSTSANGIKPPLNRELRKLVPGTQQVTSFHYVPGLSPLCSRHQTNDSLFSLPPACYPYCRVPAYFPIKGVSDQILPIS